MKKDYLTYEHTLIDHRADRKPGDNERPIIFKKANEEIRS